MNSTAPIRSRATDEGNFQLSLWGVPFLFLLVYVCLFSGLGAIGLVGPDEPRYAAIARAMAETHDWVTPRLWGTPWFEKPVLYYWAAGIAMRLFGVSEFAARLPSALAALLAVVAAGWTALRSYGLGAAWYTLLMLPASVAMIGFSRAAGPDMLFAGFLTAAMAVAVEMLQTDRPSAILRVVFGIVLGVAVLAKGPAAIILAGGATLAWGALSRHWTAPFRFLHPLVIAAFCATSLPWYILCAMRNPDFLRVFLWQHNFERYTTPIFEHRQPVWYYGYILLIAVVPWTFFLARPTIRSVFLWKRREGADSPGIFFACWALFPVLFFSLSQSKLPGYILPAIPPLFLLLGRWISQSIANHPQPTLRATGWTGAALLLFAVLLLAQVVSGIGEMLPIPYFLSESVIFIFGTAIMLAAFKKQATAGILLLVLFIPVAVEMANFWVLPALDNQASSRRLASTLLKTGATGGNLAVYKLPRAWKFGLDYYMDHELPEWNPDNSETEWILGLLPLRDIKVAEEYEIIKDESSKGIRRFLILYRRK